LRTATKSIAYLPALQSSYQHTPQLAAAAAEAVAAAATAAAAAMGI